jgi:hypothetical protein
MLEPMLPSVFEPVAEAGLSLEADVWGEALAAAGPREAPLAAVAITPRVEPESRLAVVTPGEVSRVCIEDPARVRDSVLDPERPSVVSTNEVDVVVRQEWVELRENPVLDRHTRELREIVTEPRPAPPGLTLSLAAPASAISTRTRQAAATPDVPHGQTPRQEATTIAAEPHVRISIGRVDVRAVTPNAPAERARPTKRPAEAMSLQDYLKERDGRHR